MKEKAKILNLIVPIITVVVIFVVWLIVAFSVDEEIIFPRPDTAFKEFFALFAKVSFYSSLVATLLRSLIAFVISFSLAVTCAFVSEKFVPFAKVMHTLIPLIRALPTIAVVLLLVLWTRSSTAAIIVTMLVIFPTLFSSARESIFSVGKEIPEMLAVYNIDGKTKFFKIYLPMVAPSLIYSAGTGLSLNIKLMVAAEVLAQTREGLGMMMNASKIYFETASLFALVIVSVILGLVFENLGSFIAKKMRSKYDRN